MKAGCTGFFSISFRFSKGKTVKKNKKDVKQENEDSGGGLF